MELQETATEIVRAIDKKRGNVHDVDTTLIHLVEEVGEIARLVYHEKTGRAQAGKDVMAMEVADTFILLAHLASLYDIDMEDAVRKKVEDSKKRFGV